jgi:SAM-dependent methyltransferase
MNDRVPPVKQERAATGQVPTSPVCPGCRSEASRPFYSVRQVPVHQVQLVASRKAARACRKGAIGLRFCTACGFVWNAAFDVGLMRYDEDYESTQTVSPTFNRFHERLARDLIARFDLKGRTIVEVGCGQGEFITMLAEIGGNRGFGFDRVNRGEAGSGHGVTFVKDSYGPAYAQLEPDFVCCKMTLEHVHDTGAFLQKMRQALGERPQAVIFFMIPEVTRILQLRAFWDVYYEHCSYYSPGALTRHFRIAGFDPIDVWCDYDDQYVLIAARPGTGRSPTLPGEQPGDALAPKVQAFAEGVAADLARWRSWLEERRRQGQKTVLWGGGSKAVAFLTTLGLGNQIAYTVDLNPRRAGTFIAGTGHAIMAPAALQKNPPDALIVMSPIYLPEIQAQLDALGVHPQRLLSVETLPIPIPA